VVFFLSVTRSKQKKENQMQQQQSAMTRKQFISELHKKLRQFRKDNPKISMTHLGDLDLEMQSVALDYEEDEFTFAFCDDGFLHFSGMGYSNVFLEDVKGVNHVFVLDSLIEEYLEILRMRRFKRLPEDALESIQHKRRLILDNPLFRDM
jgi:hypothetical protein